MQFDKQAHQELALQALDNVNVPGKLIDLVYEYRQSVLNATVTETEQVQTTDKKPGRPRKQTLREVGGEDTTKQEQEAGQPEGAATAAPTTDAPPRRLPVSGRGLRGSREVLRSGHARRSAQEEHLPHTRL